MRVLVLREPITLNSSLGSKSTVQGGVGEDGETDIRGDEVRAAHVACVTASWAEVASAATV